MNSGTQRILVVGEVERPLGSLLPILRRTQFTTEQVERLQDALSVVQRQVYDLIVVRVDNSAWLLETFVAKLRALHSVSRHAGLLLVADAPYLEQASAFLGRGANRVVALDSNPEEVLHGVADLIGTAPRLAVRTLAQLSVRVGRARQIDLFQTENLSALGMLLRGDCELPVGTQFDFELSLPGERQPVVGAAQVVWHTNPQRHGFAGFGVRFISFRGNDGARLRAFLQRHPPQPGLKAPSA